MSDVRGISDVVSEPSARFREVTRRNSEALARLPAEGPVQVCHHEAHVDALEKGPLIGRADEAHAPIASFPDHGDGTA